MVALAARQVCPRCNGCCSHHASCLNVVRGPTRPIRRYFFKPNAVTRQALVAKAHALGLDETWGSDGRGWLCSLRRSVFVIVHTVNVVGVHVRHGDKKTESAIIPIEDYLEAAKVSDVAEAV
jgi:hypothetical protein